ncbi:Carbamoyl-phosphate synthase large chain [Bienertia sinuspersici]
MESCGQCGSFEWAGTAVALLWVKEVEVEIKTMSLHHIDCYVKLRSEEESWRFSGIYGWHDNNSKPLTCKLLEELAISNDLPWVVGGDLNEIFYNFEKRGGATKSQGIMELLRDTCHACDLGDKEFKGNPFTWWNGRNEEQSVEERLDRFLANSRWSVAYPWAQVTHLDEAISDHLPILLKLHPRAYDPNSRTKKRFRFENMWALEEECEDVVKEGWTEGFDVDVVRNLQAKTDTYANNLMKWNKLHFGNIQHKIKELEKELRKTVEPWCRKELMEKACDLQRKE